MDYLWTPWRYAYVSGQLPGKDSDQPDLPSSGCVFCDLLAEARHSVRDGRSQAEADRVVRIVARGEHCFVVLNAFPYASGHVMVVPYQHLAWLRELPDDAAREMISWQQRLDRAFHRVYRPEGVNFGMNLGKAAGAGIAEHLHLHALPRWSGDTNFMTVVGETRVLPELLDDTWNKLHGALSGNA